MQLLFHPMTALFKCIRAVYSMVMCVVFLVTGLCHDSRAIPSVGLYNQTNKLTPDEKPETLWEKQNTEWFPGKHETVISEKIFCILNTYCPNRVKLSENSYKCKSKDNSNKFFFKSSSCFQDDLSQFFLFLNFHVMAHYWYFLPVMLSPRAIKAKKMTENVSIYPHCDLL